MPRTEGTEGVPRLGLYCIVFCGLGLTPHHRPFLLLQTQTQTTVCHAHCSSSVVAARRPKAMCMLMSRVLKQVLVGVWRGLLMRIIQA